MIPSSSRAWHIVLILVFGLHLIVVGSKGTLQASLWLDECVSYWVVHDGLRAAWDRALQFQGQSPLYFLLLSVAHSAMGSGELALRSLSILGLIWAGSALFRLIAPRCGAGAALLAIFMLFSHPEVVASSAARPYSMALGASVSSLVAALQWLESPRATVLLRLFILNVLAVYFHYLFGVVIAVQLVALLVVRPSVSVKSIIAYLATLAVSALSIAPLVHHLRSLAERSAGLSFAPQPSWDLLWGAIVPDHLNSPFGAVFFLAAALVALWSRGQVSRAILHMLVISAATIALPPAIFFAAYLVSDVSLFVPRYLLLSAVGTSTAVAVLCSLPAAAFGRWFSSLLLMCSSMWWWVPLQVSFEDWRGAISAVRTESDLSAHTVLFYSGLIEAENPSIAQDPEARDYILSALARYPLPSDRNVIAIPSHIEGEAMNVFASRIEAILRGTSDLTLVAPILPVRREGDGRSVPQYYAQALSKFGFLPVAVRQFGTVMVIPFKRMLHSEAAK